MLAKSTIFMVKTNVTRLIIDKKLEIWLFSKWRVLSEIKVVFLFVFLIDIWPTY